MTLVLDSSNHKLVWHLDLSELLNAQRKGPTLRHTVVLTNNRSEVFSEQVHPEAFLTVLRRPQLAKPPHRWTGPQSDLDAWRRNLQASGLGRLGFLTAFKSHDDNDDVGDPKVFNAVEVQLPEPQTTGEHRGGCEARSAERLSRIVSATLETALDAGFSSCRSHDWENAGGGGNGSNPPHRFLELLEFAPDFKPRQRRSPPLGSLGTVTIRLVAPPADTPGAASRVVISIFSWRAFEFQLDTRAVRRPIEVIVSSESLIFR